MTAESEGVTTSGIPEHLQGRHTSGRSINGVLHIYADDMASYLSVPLLQWWPLFDEQVKRDVVTASLLTGLNQPVHLSNYVTVHDDGEITIALEKK